MADSAITPLQEALTDIEGKIATTESSIAANNAQLDTLNAANDSLKDDLIKYQTIREDLQAAIEMLTVEEDDDPEHPTDISEDSIEIDPDEDGYDDFEYA